MLRNIRSTVPAARKFAHDYHAAAVPAYSAARQRASVLHHAFLGSLTTKSQEYSREVVGEALLNMRLVRVR